MLQEHPTTEELESFLRDAYRPGYAARNTRILRHLLAACPDCRGQLQAMGWTSHRLERLVHLPGGTAGREAQVDSYCYDSAFAKAQQAVEACLTAALPSPVPIAVVLAELEEIQPGDQLHLADAEERFANPRLVQVFIDRSHEARYADPEAMLHWASMARNVATRCTPEAAGSAGKLFDLRGKAWGQYGNALRVACRLQEAEAAMRIAQRCLKAGTNDPALRAYLSEQIASLHTYQRQFETAIAMLAEAAETYSGLGETHAFARTLVQQAITSIYSGKAEKAVELLNRAIPLVDHEGDPHLLLAACHNLVRCYIDLDRPDQALSLYSEAQDLYREFSDPLILLKTGWQEGTLLRDLGHLRSAESLLVHAQQGFLDRGLIYDAALVSLDLAALYIKLGSLEDLKQTTVAAVPIFRALGVDREALGALIQLQQVADQEQQAMELIRFLNARIEPLAQHSRLFK